MLPNDALGSAKQKPVLKLDLTKALQVQQNTVKKQLQVEQEQQNEKVEAAPLIEKIKKLDSLLDYSRRNLAREMLINKTMQLENDQLRRFNTELEARNELLVNAQSDFDERWRTLHRNYSVYRDFYKRYAAEFKESEILFTHKDQSNDGKSQSPASPHKAA